MASAPRAEVDDRWLAAWVWLVMYDIKQHQLRAEHFHRATATDLVVLAIICVVATTVVLSCNTVFAFAIAEAPPLIKPAARSARRYARRILIAGCALGVFIAAGAVVVPRIAPDLLYLAAVLALYAVMLVTLVAVPASALGKIRRRSTMTQRIGHYAATGALSVVAMLPGAVVDRVGVLLLGFAAVHVVGLVVLASGVGLYAAGLSSVKAVSLSAKLGLYESRPPANVEREEEESDGLDLA